MSDAAPTERLYYRDAYRTEFSARVVDRADDGRRLYLDSTVFYPTSGGQPHDVGTLGDARVTDVIDEDSRIAHVVDRAVDDDQVTGRIDWTRRFDHMQQHTGQHLLSAVFADLLHLNTVSVHFGDEYSTLDLEGDTTLSPEKLARVERRANDVVAEARPVTVTFEDAATAKGLRKASDRQGTLRIVSIPELDRSACGGTHVRSTSEIGAILVRGTERVRSSTRVQFLCGIRAIDRARADYLALAGIATALSAAPRDVPGIVASQAAQLKESEQARRALEKQLAAHQVAALVAAAPQDATGLKTVQATGTTEILRVMAQDALKHPRVLFIGAQDDGPGLVVAATEDSSLDAAKLLREALVAVGGKGGGSPRLAQGAAPAAQARDDAIRRITDAR